MAFILVEVIKEMKDSRREGALRTVHGSYKKIGICWIRKNQVLRNLYKEARHENLVASIKPNRHRCLNIFNVWTAFTDQEDIEKRHRRAHWH